MMSRQTYLFNWPSQSKQVILKGNRFANGCYNNYMDTLNVSLEYSFYFVFLTGLFVPRRRWRVDIINQRFRTVSCLTKVFFLFKANMGMLVEMVLCVWNFVACAFWVRSDNTVQRGIGSSMIYCVKEFYIWFDKHNSPGC